LFLVIAKHLEPAAESWMIGWNVDDHIASIFQWDCASFLSGMKEVGERFTM
jgi:hypothetical protein